jgi:GTP-binding protein
MSRGLQLTFVAAVPDFGQLPASPAEVAFLGRSNVGKSSLLNALAGERLAKVSATPGRTQVLTGFRVEGGGATLVDCPGYGYAQVSKAMRRAFVPLLEAYLLGRENLIRALLLLDGEIGPTDADLHMLAWLREHEVPAALVATKHDKVKPSQRDRRRREVAAACAVAAGEVFWVSAESGFGVPAIREQVRDWLR